MLYNRFQTDLYMRVDKLMESEYVADLTQDLLSIQNYKEQLAQDNPEKFGFIQNDYNVVNLYFEMLINEYNYARICYKDVERWLLIFRQRVVYNDRKIQDFINNGYGITDSMNKTHPNLGGFNGTGYYNINKTVSDGGFDTNTTTDTDTTVTDTSTYTTDTTNQNATDTTAQSFDNYKEVSSTTNDLQSTSVTDGSVVVTDESSGLTTVFSRDLNSQMPQSNIGSGVTQPTLDGNITWDYASSMDDKYDKTTTSGNTSSDTQNDTTVTVNDTGTTETTNTKTGEVNTTTNIGQRVSNTEGNTDSTNKTVGNTTQGVKNTFNNTTTNYGNDIQTFFQTYNVIMFSPTLRELLHATFDDLFLTVWDDEDEL